MMINSEHRHSSTNQRLSDTHAAPMLLQLIRVNLRFNVFFFLANDILTMANLEIPSTSPVDTQSNKKSTAVQFNVDRQCPVQYVTVYNDRAEVTRLVQHHFDAEGTYDLVIQGFSPSVDLTSLHVSGATSKACTILEVSYQTRNEDSMVSSELTSIDQLQNEVEQIQLDLDKHEQQLARLTKQRTWLDGRASKLMNQDGQMNNNDLEMMQQFLEFYHKNLFKLDGETTSEQLLIKDMKRKQDGLRKDTLRRGADGQAQHQKTIREVTITIHISMSNIDVSLEIAYLITNCSWNASYDVRINNSEGARPRTQLTYYGSIVNQSQENWIDVQLSLSTATPSLSGDHPKLGTLKIDYYTPRRHYGLPAQKSGESLSSYAMNDCITEATAFKLSSRKFRSMSFRGRKHLRSSDASIDEEDSEINHSVNVLETHTEASLSSSSFAIPRRATIEADGKPHKVTIGVLDLTSTFTYTVIPKFSTHAYLKAKTINTSDKQLLSGQASIFMDNNFITRSSIENVCVGDTFDLSLGTDATIKVDYKPVKKLADTQGFISKVKHETIRHETRLVNTKSMEVTVFVYQQVPLPTIEKIKVKLNQPDLRAKEQGLNYTVTMDDSNNLEWKCVLPPRGECRLPLEYTIEWPADKQIEYADS